MESGIKAEKKVRVSIDGGNVDCPVGVRGFLVRLHHDGDQLADDMCVASFGSPEARDEMRR